VALSKAVATVLKKEAGALERLVKMFDKKWGDSSTGVPSHLVRQ
jgi:hypothetical protein